MSEKSARPEIQTHSSDKMYEEMKDFTQVAISRQPSGTIMQYPRSAIPSDSVMSINDFSAYSQPMQEQIYARTVEYYYIEKQIEKIIRD